MVGSPSSEEKEFFERHEQARESVIKDLVTYKQNLEQIVSSMKKTIAGKFGAEGVGALGGYLKGLADGNAIADILNPYDCAKHVDIAFDWGLTPLVDLPTFFGNNNNPLIPPGKTEWWYNLCQALGIKAQTIAPVVEALVGFGMGTIVSAAIGYLRDRKILKSLGAIEAYISALRTDILVYSELQNSVESVKQRIFKRIKNSRFWQKVKNLGYVIKSLGLMMVVYFAFRIITSVISPLLGLYNVPDVINTAEEANYWAKFVYDTVMAVKDIMPEAIRQTGLLAVGGGIAYGVGKGLETLGDVKMMNNIKEICIDVDEIRKVYKQGQ